MRNFVALVLYAEKISYLLFHFFISTYTPLSILYTSANALALLIKLG